MDKWENTRKRHLQTLLRNLVNIYGHKCVREVLNNMQCNNLSSNGTMRCTLKPDHDGKHQCGGKEWD
jgi:hypothetical protein